MIRVKLLTANAVAKQIIFATFKKSTCIYSYNGENMNIKRGETVYCSDVVFSVVFEPELNDLLIHGVI